MTQNRYVTPVYFLGARVICEIRGLVRIVGLSDGPMPWPIGEQDYKRELIVYRGLARALRTEGAAAIATAWGVPLETVETWQHRFANQPAKTQRRRERSVKAKRRESIRRQRVKGC
jgi:hypothetical protein